MDGADGAAGDPTLVPTQPSPGIMTAADTARSGAVGGGGGSQHGAVADDEMPQLTATLPLLSEAVEDGSRSNGGANAAADAAGGGSIGQGGEQQDEPVGAVMEDMLCVLDAAQRWACGDTSTDDNCWLMLHSGIRFHGYEQHICPVSGGHGPFEKSNCSPHRPATAHAGSAPAAASQADDTQQKAGSASGLVPAATAHGDIGILPCSQTAGDAGADREPPATAHSMAEVADALAANRAPGADEQLVGSLADVRAADCITLAAVLADAAELREQVAEHAGELCVADYEVGVAEQTSGDEAEDDIPLADLAAALQASAGVAKKHVAAVDRCESNLLSSEPDMTCNTRRYHQRLIDTFVSFSCC